MTLYHLLCALTQHPYRAYGDNYEAPGVLSMTGTAPTYQTRYTKEASDLVWRDRARRSEDNSSRACALPGAVPANEVKV
jgi:hypothetical protein